MKTGRPSLHTPIINLRNVSNACLNPRVSNVYVLFRTVRIGHSHPDPIVESRYMCAILLISLQTPA